MKVNARTSGFVLLVGLCLVWILLSCGEDDITLGHKAYKVSGTVSDSITGLPIDSAKITPNDTFYDTSDVVEPWWTDSAGLYAIPTERSTITIFVRKEGYYTKFQCLENVRSDTSGVDFQLVPME